MQLKVMVANGLKSLLISAFVAIAAMPVYAGCLDLLKSATSFTGREIANQIDRHILGELKTFDLENYRRQLSIYREARKQKDYSKVERPITFEQKLAFIRVQSENFNSIFEVQPLDVESIMDPNVKMASKRRHQRELALRLRNLDFSKGVSAQRIENELTEIYSNVNSNLESLPEFISRLPHLPQALRDRFAASGHENARNESLQDEMIRRKFEIKIASTMMKRAVDQMNALKGPSRWETLSSKAHPYNQVFKTFVWNSNIVGVYHLTGIPLLLYIPYFKNIDFIKSLKSIPVTEADVDTIMKGDLSGQANYNRLKKFFRYRYTHIVPFHLTRKVMHKAAMLATAFALLNKLDQDIDHDEAQQGIALHQTVDKLTSSFTPQIIHKQIKNADTIPELEKQMKDVGLDIEILNNLQTQVSTARQKSPAKKIFVATTTSGLAAISLTAERIFTSSYESGIRMAMRGAMLYGLFSADDAYLDAASAKDLSEKILVAQHELIHQKSAVEGKIARLKKSALVVKTSSLP